MFRYDERYGFWGNPNVLRWLLCRSPTPFAAQTVRERRTCNDDAKEAVE